MLFGMSTEIGRFFSGLVQSYLFFLSSPPWSRSIIRVSLHNPVAGNYMISLLAFLPSCGIPAAFVCIVPAADGLSASLLDININHAPQLAVGFLFWL